MKRTVIAIIVLAIVLTAVTAALAANPISLVVSGKEIKTDIPPRLINGRVMVPIRFVAEALGTEVKWDEKKNAVLIGNDIWDEQLDHSKGSLYSAVTAVTSYLSLLQANIGGAVAGITYESGTGVRGHIGWNSVLSEKALDAGYGMERVWVPMGGMTGSSVRQVVRFEILDGRRIKDDQGRDAFEIAARYWFSDLTDDKQPYTRVTKAYTVVLETKLNERGGKYMAWVVDNEKTIDIKALSERPALWR